MPDIVHLNGEYLPRGEAWISPDDRGFLLADGLYEVSPAYRGSFLALERHLARLGRGADAIGLSLPTGLEELHVELLRRNGLDEEPTAMVYLQVTRGVAPRTHHFPDPPPAPTVYAFARPFVRPDQARWSAGYGAVSVPDRRWSRADLKTIQLLPQALAQQAAREAGEDDALLVRDGLALEGAHHNVFFVRDGTLLTHPPSNQILPGITRGIVLEEARSEGIPVEERPVGLEESRTSDEMFFTGTTTEIRPAVRLDGRPIGDGSVGPLTRRVRELFLRRIEQERAPD